jgi:hypothetical protein
LINELIAGRIRRAGLEIEGPTNGPAAPADGARDREIWRITANSVD